jgi:hypothetical protein
MTIGISARKRRTNPRNRCWPPARSVEINVGQTKMKKALAIFVAVLLSAVAGGEEPASVAGVYRGSSGIETRTVTLLTNGNYLARWDGDIGSNGSSAGTWKLAGAEVRLSPKKEEGMISGHFRVLLVRDFNGRRALLRKEDEKYSDIDLFYLFLQTKEPNQSAKPTPPMGG